MLRVERHGSQSANRIYGTEEKNFVIYIEKNRNTGVQEGDPLSWGRLRRRRRCQCHLVAGTEEPNATHKINGSKDTEPEPSRED